MSRKVAPKTGKKSAAKKSSGPSKPETAEASAMAGVGNVDQIREIIFGGQMRDYESRFEALSRHLKETAKNQREDFDLKLGALDKALDKESKKTSDRFKKENTERSSNVSQLREEISQLRNDNDSRATELDDLIEKETRTLLSELHETRSDLLNRINEQVEALQNRLDDETRRLDERKVSREELAGLLNEVAMRLTGDFELPSGKS